MFFFHFCNFGRRPHFLDNEVTQTVTQTGQKSARRRHFRLRAFLLFREIFRSLQRRRQDLFHGPGSLFLGCRSYVGVGIQGEAR